MFECLAKNITCFTFGMYCTAKLEAAPSRAVYHLNCVLTDLEPESLRRWLGTSRRLSDGEGAFLYFFAGDLG